MKKLFVIALAALMSVTAFSQDFDDEYIYQSKDGLVTLNILEHIGYGYHFLDTDSFKPSDAGEFFFNILKLKIYPIERVGLEISADWKFSHFASKENGFELDGSNKVQPFVLSQKFGSDINKARGWMHVNSFSFPAILKVGSESIKIGAGIEADYNYRGTVNYKYKTDGKRKHEKVKGMELNTWTYNFIGVVYLDGLTVYGKYYPNGFSVLADGSGVKMDYWTLGIGFDF